MSDSLQSFLDKLNKVVMAAHQCAPNSLNADKTSDSALQRSLVQVTEWYSAQQALEAAKTQALKVVSDYNLLIKNASTPEEKAQYRQDQAPYKTAAAGYQTQIDLLDQYITVVRATKRNLPATLLAEGDAALAASGVPVIFKSSVKSVTYNVGSVREAYFTGKESFMKEMAQYPSNIPIRVNNAANLWVGGAANKGMLQTWSPPGGGTGMEADTTSSDVTTDNKNHAMPGNKISNNTPYAFQFQYNPTNIQMVYSGTPQVDMSFEASGQDKFNFIGTGTTQSTIGFQILINRVYDMKHYTTEGWLRSDSQQAYFPVSPAGNEMQAIYNQGTMYDVEFLLRTLIGGTFKSYLREDYLGGGTADMGFVSAVPVELHLGKNLRYLVYINQLSINHVLFNERMVPLFTTIDVSCNRMPDFADTSSSTTTDPSTSTDTSISTISKILFNPSAPWTAGINGIGSINTNEYGPYVFDGSW